MAGRLNTWKRQTNKPLLAMITWRSRWFLERHKVLAVRSYADRQRLVLQNDHRCTCVEVNLRLRPRLVFHPSECQRENTLQVSDAPVAPFKWGGLVRFCDVTKVFRSQVWHMKTIVEKAPPEDVGPRCHTRDNGFCESTGGWCKSVSANGKPWDRTTFSERKI